ncbi:MAG: tetratricopeptide repeat protein [Acetobacter sp.]|nr:tetratricopeptide repeat protein [Acetobacter sp.]
MRKKYKNISPYLGAGFIALSLLSIAPAHAQSAAALLEKGMDFYGQGGHLDESLATYNKLINRFSNSQDPEERYNVAQALYNKNIVLVTLQRYKEALSTCNELIKRYGDAQDPEIQRVIAQALYSKGNILCELLNQRQQAQEVFTEIINRFSDTRDPQIQRVVNKAKVYLMVRQ